MTLITEAPFAPAMPDAAPSPLTRPFRALIAAREAFTELRPTDAVASALVVVSLTVLASFLLQPFVLPLMGKGEMPLAGRLMLLVVDTIATAGRLAIKWSIFGYLVYALATAAGREGPLHRAFALVVLAEMPRVVGFYAELAIVAFRGQAPQSVADLSPAMGLNLIFTDLAPRMDRILNAVSVYAVWYVVVLAVGVHVAFDAPPRRAAAVALAVWLFGFLVHCAFAFIGTAGG